MQSRRSRMTGHNTPGTCTIELQGKCNSGIRDVPAWQGTTLLVHVPLELQGKCNSGSRDVPAWQGTTLLVRVPYSYRGSVIQAVVKFPHDRAQHSWYLYHRAIGKVLLNCGYRPGHQQWAAHSNTEKGTGKEESANLQSRQIYTG